MILVVRPEPGTQSTLKVAREMGLEAIGCPLFEIRPVAWECPEPDGVDALLIGSANAIRHGGDSLASMCSKPVHAVGQATANAAQEAGFSIASVGTGGLQTVLNAIPAPIRLLRLAGAHHVPLEVPEGITIDTRIVYESAPLELSDPPGALSEPGLVVLLHSAAAAEHFDKESRRLGLNREHISLAVIGPRVASAAGKGWRAIHVSPAPNDHDLLEMVRTECI